jgi:CubicO group peptidase (beta-lactamase class C family)
MMSSSRLWLTVHVCCVVQFAAAQQKPAMSLEIEQHIQHVVSGLSEPVIIKGDQDARHSLADRMKQLNVPGVSIALIHNGKIEWARGFGVRSTGGHPVDDATLFQAASIGKPLSAMQPSTWFSRENSRSTRMPKAK